MKLSRDGDVTALGRVLQSTSEVPGTFQSTHPYTLKFRRWCKFNLVGGAGILVQFATLFVLKGALHVQYLAATALAVETAVLHNFFWHERYTWADRCTSQSWRPSPRRLLRFHLANGAVSIIGNLALMKVMVGQGHMNYLIANSIAICLCSLANFLVSEEWVFE